ncbi:MAG: uncharacterized protein H6Q78_1321, partial [Candidatus Krumholzibacteriota bacterium]|nr:uncharacterized protein [Candidatus Krumholzibacteriota bacterium]
DAQEVLQYFRIIGENAIPGLCELLTTLKDPSLHKCACDILIEIADKDVPRIVNDFNLDNPFEAKDAVYLLTRSTTKEIHPVAGKLVGSADPRVRELVVEYLAAVDNDEAATLLCGLLEDADPGVRIKTFAAVEESRHPMIVDRVLEACFAEDNASRSVDELERMFRAAGRLGGARTVDSTRHMIGKSPWFRIGKGRSRQNKLLAITALRHSECPEAMKLLGELAQDGESLVRTKAAYALKHLESPVDSAAADLASVAEEDTAP